MIATVNLGIQSVAQTALNFSDPNITVGEAIAQALGDAQDEGHAEQTHTAMADPHSIIEIRCGTLIQTATPDMPLRELLKPEQLGPGPSRLEFTVSQPHVGG